MIRALLTALVGLVLLVPLAQGEEKTIDELICRSGTVTLLFSSKEATILAIDSKNIFVKTGLTSRCNGVISIIAGKRKGNGYCKNLDSDGDFRLVEWTGSGKRGEGTWKYLYGTGKWKGITGGGEYKRVITGKPIAKGTYQSCTRLTGTYELPK